MKSHVCRQFLLCCGVLCLSGCLLPEREYQETHYYDLHADTVAEAMPKVGDLLVIGRFRVIGPYRTRMVRRHTTNRLSLDEFHRWVQPPEKLAAQEAQRFFARTEMFGRVVASPAVHGDFHLSGVIHKLEYGPDQNARMKIEFLVRSLDTDTVVFHKIYLSQKKVGGDKADHIAAAQAANLQDILSRLAHDLEKR